jgi:hypothetical protein
MPAAPMPCIDSPAIDTELDTARTAFIHLSCHRAGTQ